MERSSRSGKASRLTTWSHTKASTNRATLCCFLLKSTVAEWHDMQYVAEVSVVSSSTLPDLTLEAPPCWRLRRACRLVPPLGSVARPSLYGAALTAWTRSRTASKRALHLVDKPASPALVQSFAPTCGSCELARRKLHLGGSALACTLASIEGARAPCRSSTLLGRGQAEPLESSGQRSRRLAAMEVPSL